jgi:Domain of unknown function (DUF5658)
LKADNNNGDGLNPIPPERRNRQERRKTDGKSMLHAFFATRRRDQRRDGEPVAYYTDWYGIPLFLLAVGIVLLCVADAFFTLQLISLGGAELNPFMAYLLDQGLYAFVGIKMALTVLAIIVLVMHQRFSFLPGVRAFHVLLVTFIGYGVLVAYELSLLAPEWL